MAEDAFPAWAQDAPEPIKEIAKKHGEDHNAALEEITNLYKSAQTKIGEQGTRLGDLEKKLSETPPPVASDAAAPNYQSTDDIIKAAGLNKEALVEAYAQNGQLADEHYKALQKLGYGKMVVDAFIGGEHAQSQLSAMQQDRLANMAFEIAGGEDAYKNMIEWAKINLPPNQLQSFDEMVSGPRANETTITQAVEWLNGRYVAANGAPGGGLPGTRLAAGGGGGGGGVFTTRDEAVAAMADKRYAETLPGGQRNPNHDRAYKQQVDARLLATLRKQGKS